VAAAAGAGGGGGAAFGAGAAGAGLAGAGLAGAAAGDPGDVCASVPMETQKNPRRTADLRDNGVIGCS